MAPSLPCPPPCLQRLTRSMLGRMLDPEQGITQAAATCPSYGIDDAAVMQQSQWAQEVRDTTCQYCTANVTC
jgi:hypothetical protein